VGGGNDADVQGDGFGTTHPFDDLFLEDPQHPDLRRERQFTDFIQKDRPLMASFKTSPLGLDGTGKGPLLVTKQLAVDERFRNCTAVDGNERPLVPGGQTVNCPGHDPLAYPGFSQEQHGAFQRRHLPDHFHDLLQPEIRADDLAGGHAEQLLAQIAVVIRQPVFEAEHLLMGEGIG